MFADPSQLALWGLVAVNVAGIIKQLIDKRADTNRLILEHEFRKQDAEDTARVRRSIDDRLADTTRGIAANRAQLKAVGEKADDAYNAANHINEKLANAATATLVLAESIRETDVTVAALSAGAKAQIESAVRHELANFIQGLLLQKELELVLQTSAERQKAG